MPQPKKKRSKSKQGHHVAHWMRLDMPNIFDCPQCGAPVLAHQACSACGTYKGRQVLTIKGPKTKDADKSKPKVKDKPKAKAKPTAKAKDKDKPKDKKK